MSQYLFVSVIIPVYNDRERLALCLEALEKQSYSRDQYEIIVVDNASDQDIVSLASQFPHVTYNHEGKRGSYAARNKGISVSRGSVVAFTDSDCIPNYDWIKEGVITITGKENCGLVAGAIEVFFSKPDSPTPVELYESITAFPQREYVEKEHFGATANVFTYRSVIDTVGLFNETLTTGGDKEWGRRVHAAGYEVCYSSATIIRHPARRSMAEIVNKILRVAEGHERIETSHPTRWGIYKRAFWDLYPPMKHLATFLRAPELPKLSHRIKATYVSLVITYVYRWARIRCALDSRAD